MNRLTAHVLAAVTATALAAPALAEDVPTVAEHLCTFAGKCDGLKLDASGASREVGATKGFRLARAVPAATAAPATRTVRHSRAQTAAAAARVAETMPVGRGSAGGQRGDLRIAFALNSAEMTPVGITAAHNFALAAKDPALAGARFAIEGHTDSLGTPEINRDLSQRRAKAVADYLVSQGVSRDRLEVQGFGARQPIAGTLASNPANRRVEALRLR